MFDRFHNIATSQALRRVNLFGVEQAIFGPKSIDNKSAIPGTVGTIIAAPMTLIGSKVALRSTPDSQPSRMGNAALWDCHHLKRKPLRSWCLLAAPSSPEATKEIKEMGAIMDRNGRNPKSATDILWSETAMDLAGEANGFLPRETAPLPNVNV